MHGIEVCLLVVAFWLTVILVPHPALTQDEELPESSTALFNLHPDPERRLNIDYDPFDHSMMADRQEGQDCQDECDRFVGYGAGLCATISSFTANVGCFIVTFANPIHCGVLQGVMFAFGGYCTSSAPARICAVCREGFTMNMILHREILIDRQMEKVKNMQKDLEIVREEMAFMSQTWHAKQNTFDMQLRSAGHFDDVDHLLQVMSLIEYSPEGVPVDNHALKLFLDTALSPARHGVLNLINKFHRIFAGGGHCAKCFGGRKSIFEINPDFYCQTEVVTDLDNALFGCYHAFFFAMKLKGEETEKYESEFARMRKQEFDEFSRFCQTKSSEATTSKCQDEECEGPSQEPAWDSSDPKEEPRTNWKIRLN
ncbi:uncharacterized protein LOC131878313 [Tigriopus californicus]|uniref:uncharacterized protein LOC131878313 n=1 Tax=Tigriopus californicus TaxID=6832 RepID=UPI0027DA6701|nr:uncharacterized protein LOC131878313 [Tigriopus californicus]